MLPSPEQLVQQVHDSPTQLVMAITGGGSRAVADLLEVPGGSRTLLEAIIPYSAPAMVELLGGMPDEFCSAAAARAMAMAAFRRALRCAPADAAVAGVSCTASLATDRPKRGPHRAHLAMQTVTTTAAWRLVLHKDRRSRAEEERLVGRLLLNVIAESCNVSERLKLELLEGENVEASRVDAPREWQDLLLGRSETVRITAQEGHPPLVMPGAFNPLHAGHRRMLEVAQEITGHPPALELSIINVDKPPLDYVEIQRRLAQFPAEQPVYLTRAATFEEKSRLFPTATFIVGVDTLRRVVSPQYYGGDERACRLATERIAARGCRFLVFGRDLGVGFVRLADLDLPQEVQSLCREVPPHVFREDVSSTELRKMGQ